MDKQQLIKITSEDFVKFLEEKRVVDSYVKNLENCQPNRKSRLIGDMSFVTGAFNWDSAFYPSDMTIACKCDFWGSIHRSWHRLVLDKKK